MPEVWLRVELIDDEPRQYCVPSMIDIREIEPNGYTVASTFSGCGGSSLGYALAGFRVAWASEFVDAASQIYAANFRSTILDTRDIRCVRADDILSALKMDVGQLDVLDGSPPCASFSSLGSREAGWGKLKTYSDTKQRTDDLFFEFARLVDGVRPKVFVAENVKGLVTGKAKGYFLLILSALKSCGYQVVCRVLDAQWLGVPQTRSRCIFVGVRNDLRGTPQHPTPLERQVPLRVALDRVSSHVESETDIGGTCLSEPAKKLKQGQTSSKYFQLQRASLHRPCPAIIASGGARGSASVIHPIHQRKFSIAELKRICSFPDDFELSGSYKDQYERLGRAVPPIMMSHIARTVRDRILREGNV